MHLISLEGDGSPFIPSHSGPNLFSTMPIAGILLGIDLSLAQASPEEYQRSHLVLVLASLTFAPDGCS